MPEATLPTTDDPTAVTVLDAYLAKLQAGEQPDKAALLNAHPELAGAVECMEALDQLAPPRPPAEIATADPDATIGMAPSGASSPPPIVDLDFGKFELISEIGRGGMGVVYKARQKDLNRIVALKMVLASQLASKEVIQRFRNEARAVAGIQHANITTVYEVGEMHGQPYIAIQYIGGLSLGHRLAGGPLQAETAARIVAQVARAVHHLHVNGVIHRDLKPSNILLDEKGQPFVTDFGLVKLITGDSQMTTTGVVLGTPSYMAPEQAAARSSEVGPLSDVYSIGAVLYECLTGRPPFREATHLETLVQVLETEPARPRMSHPSVPRDLEGICLRCLEKAPERRYASAAAVAENLQRYLDGEVVEGQAPGFVRRFARWARREPALVARLVTFGACAVLVQVNYQLASKVEPRVHFEIMGLLVLWCAASFVFQKIQNTGRWAGDLPFAWSGVDILVWTLLLMVYGDGPKTPVLIGYPCLIASAGLWFRVRLVWFTTILSLLSYAGVLVAYVADHGREALHGPHMDLIFAVGLVALGYVVAYQVQRVKALSRYYEHRPLPK
jgi:serine/threonine-protein kinase